MLDRCQYSPADLLVSVGDLVNKGPESLQVLETVRDYKIHAVRGNHDDAALAAFAAKGPKKSKYAWVAALDSRLAADTLGALPFSLSLPGYNVTVVHAGVVPGRALEDQSLADLIKVRTRGRGERCEKMRMREIAVGVGWGVAGSSTASLPMRSSYTCRCGTWCLLQRRWMPQILPLHPKRKAPRPAAQQRAAPGGTGMPWCSRQLLPQGRTMHLCQEPL